MSLALLVRKLRLRLRLRLRKRARLTGARRSRSAEVAYERMLSKRAQGKDPLLAPEDWTKTSLPKVFTCWKFNNRNARGRKEEEETCP